MRPGVFKEQTRDQAWNDARAVVRHYIGTMGYDLSMVGALLDPPIKDEGTIRKHFGHEVQYGRAVQDARLGAVAYQMAVSGRHEGMTRFMCRTKLGWSEDAGGGNGASIVVIERIPGDSTL